MLRSKTPSLRYKQREGDVLARRRTYETLLSPGGVQSVSLRTAIASKCDANTDVGVRHLSRKMTKKGVLDIFEVTLTTQVNPLALASKFMYKPHVVPYAS